MAQNKGILWVVCDTYPPNKAPIEIKKGEQPVKFITRGTRVVVLSYADENGDGDWLQPQSTTQMREQTRPQARTPQVPYTRVSHLKLRPRGRGVA